MDPGSGSSTSVCRAPLSPVWSSEHFPSLYELAAPSVACLLLCEAHCLCCGGWTGVLWPAAKCPSVWPLIPWRYPRYMIIVPKSQDK